MTPEDIRTRLLAVANRGKLPPDFDAEDMVNEAVATALAKDRALEGTKLFEKAAAELSELRRVAHWRRKRDATAQDGVRTTSVDGNHVFRRRKARKARKLPKGTLRFASKEVHPGVLPLGEENVLDLHRRGAAERLAHEALLRIAAGEPCSRRAEKLLVELYAEIYGVAPGEHWAYLMIDEVERAKRQSIRFERTAEEASESSFVTFTRRGISGDMGAVEKRPLLAIQTPTTAGRAKQDYYAEIDGKPEHLGTNVGIVGDEFVYSPEDGERSEQVLQQVRLRLAQLYVSHEIPDYANNATLVRWLLARFGFGGGGGANAMKKASLRKLLVNPEGLANEILKHGKRVAERADADAASALERAASALAVSVNTMRRPD